MAVVPPGAVARSPQRSRLSSHQYCSLDVSLLSPDSSYLCSRSVGGHSVCCRRSARLLTNGYYQVTADSFSWDEDGTVYLSPCAASVCYKERLFRVFRRRRRPRSSLLGLLSGLTDSYQSWLGGTFFRGLFGTSLGQDLDLSLDLDLDLDWTRRLVPADGSPWTKLDSTELEDRLHLAYDDLPLVQEEIGSEFCPSRATVSGLSEVPPPSSFYATSCYCPPPPEPPGMSTTALLLFSLSVFILAALLSRCWPWGDAAAVALVLAAAVLVMARSGLRRRRRRARTEDITSRNE